MTNPDGRPAIQVAPSLLAADPLRFAEELQSVEKAGADVHHVDVMDGHFVPNLTYGMPFVKAMKNFAKIPLDVHIMVSNPDQTAMDYVRAGADILVFHIEAAVHPHRIIQEVHGAGRQAGIAINPGTPTEVLRPLLPFADVINVMSVNPGFGGQKFIETTPDRVGQIFDDLSKIGRQGQCRIEVDGGINDQTGPLVSDRGASLLVAGTYVYGADVREKAIASLRD